MNNFNSVKVIVKILKLISILTVISIVAVFVMMIFVIRNPMFNHFMNTMQIAFVLTIVGLLLAFVLGPYAAINLWRLNDKGRKATIFLFGYTALYDSYCIYYYPPPFYQALITKAIIASLVLGIIILLLPISQIACGKTVNSSKFMDIIRTLSVTEKITIKISLLALIVSSANLYFTNFYKKDMLTASIGDVLIKDSSIELPVTIINSGNTNVAVNYMGIAYTRKELITKSLFSEMNSWTYASNCKVTPNKNFVIKSGEIILIDVSGSTGISESINMYDNDEVVLGIAVHCIDSKGKRHISNNIIGNMTIRDKKIISLNAGKRISVMNKNGTMSHEFIDGTYETIFSLL